MITGLPLHYISKAASDNGPSPKMISPPNREPASSEKIRSEDPLMKRLEDNLESLQRLREMPKQADMNTAGLHRQRLEMLKMLLLYASPKQVEAIAEELKSIAKELAAISKSIGGNDRGNMPSAATLNINAITATAHQDVKTAEAQAAMAEAKAAQSMGQEASAVEADAAVYNSPPVTSDETDLGDAPRGGESLSTHMEDDKALRGLLEETQKLIEEIIAILKSKLAEADREAKKDLADAEKSVNIISRSLSQTSRDTLYSALGNLLPATGTMAASAAISSMSLRINIEV